MNPTPPEHPSPASPGTYPPLRLRPGVIIVALQWLSWLVLPLIVPETLMYGMMAGLGGGLAVLVWWLLFSRAPWLERVGAIVLMVVALLVTSRLVHPSIANGMMGMMLPLYAVPLLCLALVAWAAATRQLSRGRRRAWLPVALGLACAVATLVRTDGLQGNGVSDLHWRWSPTPEERLLAQARQPARKGPAAGSVVATTVSPAANTSAQWPGFRGPQRDGVVRGIRIATDWSRSAPVELWRQPVGPGWSSFAVDGNRFYTQEQRGEAETVSCYDLTTGATVWQHGDPVRFWESNAGAGPRGTPSLSNGRVYTFGATGVLNALDARNGSVLWSRQAATETGRKTPEWGFASSPLVVDDLVVIATAGVLAAYDAGTGQPRWMGPKEGWGYSSPHLWTIAGTSQIVLLNGAGAIGVGLTDGQPLWRHPWKSDGIVQPAMLADGDILLGSGSGLGGQVGVRRLTVTRGPAGWTAGERWTSIGLKPYFNDFVVHQGHAYGFNGTTLACIELTDGRRAWKGGRYGNGQVILLADQDLILVLSEQGELALVAAHPGEFRELARFPALTDKTWNHPVLAGNILLVRNDREMVAFRLP